MIAKRSHWILRGAAVAALLLAWNTASAQHSSGFEQPACVGSAAGTDLNGQDGFYNPDPATSVSAKVYTYAGNVLGIPPNPSGGGDQFVGAEGPGNSSGTTMYARSQKDIPFGTGTGMWTVAVDVAITFTGTPPTADNVGSISLSPLDPAAPTNQAFIALARWADPTGATLWNADFIYWPASGSYVITTVPDPAFQNLLVNHWYRWSITFDLDTALVTELGIVDLTTGLGGTYNPTGWYLAGGASILPAPTGFRFFGGTSTYAGNTTCWDNLDIDPFVACPEDINGDGVVDVLDLLQLLADWGMAGGPSDVNGDGVVDVLDLLMVLAAWGPC
jgi:hypothetical protein